ncbi:MAG: methyltransferase [Saprospiraceae bacterium]|nr:methyltransferase [Saprospiraceae bacterium]
MKTEPIKRLEFLRESLRDIKTVGTLTPSSRHLCESMIRHIDFENGITIVELGAGDGVITHQLLSKMPVDSRLIVFEVNEKFCRTLRQIHDPRFILIDDTAEKLDDYLNQLHIDHIDYVISALPFTSLPRTLGINIVKQCYQHLNKGGLFVQMHYSLFTKRLYKKIFGNVDVCFVPLNLPPAFVFVSEKI